jgi:hypothetical protein
VSIHRNHIGSRCGARSVRQRTDRPRADGHAPFLQPLEFLFMAHTARIVGKVEYREGDGPNIAIRPGPVQFQMGINDVTLSWVDEETRGSAAMPLTDFKRLVSEGCIVLEGPMPPPKDA